MNTQQEERPLLILLLLSAGILFVSVMALVSGFSMMIDSSGAGIGMELSWLKNTPFQNYLFPGLWLFIVYGIGGLLLLYALWFRPGWSWLANLMPWTHEHAAWGLSVLLGIVIMVWIVVQVTWIPPSAPLLPAVIFAIGLAMVVLPLFPAMRRYYAR